MYIPIWILCMEQTSHGIRMERLGCSNRSIPYKGAISCVSFLEVITNMACMFGSHLLAF